MYIKVRTMDGTKTAVVTISKVSKVDDFRTLVQERFNVPPNRQRLFYRGKQMENGYTLFDYNINVNDVIMLMIKPVLSDVRADNTLKKNGILKKDLEPRDKKNVENENQKSIKEVEGESEYYKVGDLVDALYVSCGTWWEAKILKITLNPVKYQEDGFLYHIAFENYEDELIPLTLKHIRPRAWKLVDLDDLKPGDMIMANYNLEDPQERGHWYDCKVKKTINTRTQKEVIATVYLDSDESPLEDCRLCFVKELFKIEKNVKFSERESDMEMGLARGSSPAIRENAPHCPTCKDNPKRKCRDCGCQKCHGKDNPEKQLMCDECDSPFHIYCLDPPLEVIPDVEEWFCPLCKNDDSEIVRAGEKLKDSKKKSRMASKVNTSTKRDWGKGFACAGRQKVCTIVARNHFGPIPNVEVGMSWFFRLQVSEYGVHRPHVGGIHGKEQEGAYSLVLSGGYEDDEDNGDSFTYTGSGGRDLSGNKRTAEQSCDQTLTRNNKALALNCNVPVNKNGAEAKNWKDGKPVRVVRSSKGRKHSKYAPEIGNRYDGIYKVVKYWQDTGKSGFKVWRYLLRRDDPSPAPWTKLGQKRIQDLGLEMQYPVGYHDALKEKELAKQKASESNGSDDEGKPMKGKTAKRKKSEVDSEENNNTKKRKLVTFKLAPDLQKLISNDSINSNLWNECKKQQPNGRAQFLNTVEERFLCICCQELVFKPVTTECKHNICLPCLQRSFKAEVYTCPACRFDLGKGYKMEVNETLRKCLVMLLPGYDAGR